MTLLLYISLLCANLATAPGSFLVNGFRVWTNGSVGPGSVIQTGNVPVTIFQPSGSRIVVAPHSEVVVNASGVQIKTGSARLTPEKAGNGQPDQELRPLSQRP